MIELKSSNDIDFNSYVKIESDSPKYCYEKVRIEKIIPMVNIKSQSTIPYDYEYVFDKKKNHYFSLNAYLEGRSWVKKCWVYPSIRQLESKLAEKEKENKRLRECIAENLKMDIEMFEKSNGAGASLSNIMRSKQCLNDQTKGE